MPRLRFIFKVVISFILLLVLFKILGQQPPPPPPALEEPQLPQPPEVVEEEIKEPTEEEMLAIGRREEWIWKDFPTYVTKTHCLALGNSDILLTATTVSPAARPTCRSAPLVKLTARTAYLSLCDMMATNIFRNLSRR
jgi:hypothetical protein